MIPSHWNQRSGRWLALGSGDCCALSKVGATLAWRLLSYRRENQQTNSSPGSFVSPQCQRFQVETWGTVSPRRTLPTESSSGNRDEEAGSHDTGTKGSLQGTQAKTLLTVAQETQANRQAESMSTQVQPRAAAGWALHGHLLPFKDTEQRTFKYRREARYPGSR